MRTRAIVAEIMIVEEIMHHARAYLVVLVLQAKHCLGRLAGASYAAQLRCFKVLRSSTQTTARYVV